MLTTAPGRCLARMQHQVCMECSKGIPIWIVVISSEHPHEAFWLCNPSFHPHTHDA